MRAYEIQSQRRQEQPAAVAQTALDVADIGPWLAATFGSVFATTLHIGPYEAMEPAYEAVASWIDQQVGERSGDPWEVHFSDPQEEIDPDTWKTEVVQPYQATSTRD
jgi:effector-binding domain-containing protein